MRARPLVVFLLVAGLLVGWLSVRMWFGALPGVWRVSCLLGAWAPLAAAALFLYVREVGDREHSVGAAWLVRAIGMHCTLLWMLGTNDWLRGPPGHLARWDADLGAPLVLLWFVPAFALSLGTLEWARSLAQRLPGVVVRPAMPGETGAGTAPFRGLPLVATASPAPLRAPVAPLLVGSGACALALGSSDAPFWLLCAGALVLGALTLRNHRALAPSITVLVALAAVVLSRVGAHDATALVALGVAWPWLALAGVGCYLATVEALLRIRH
jgi:hypothetical protein